MPIILATQEAEIRKTMVQSLPRLFPIWKKPKAKKTLVEWLKAVGVAQGVGP
jgi:hypothetical protein